VKNFGRCLKFLIPCLFVCSIAQAQATRTWVSGVGDDANPCSRTAPCKTFAGAISKTAASGEIDALDPAGFGAVTITKAITIDGGGQLSSVLVAGTNGIVISAGATDVVTLRNLSINGIGSGINGIAFLTGGTLHIENCTVSGFTRNGIDIEPTTGGNVSISKSISRDNGGSGIFGQSSGTTLSVTISDSQFEHNVIGVFASDFTQFVVRNSDASGNSLIGFCADANGSGTVLDIINSTAANNGSTGIQAGGGGGNAVVHLSGVFTSNNAVIGWSKGLNGSIISFGNNYDAGVLVPTSLIPPK
jgi:hypothetical protein